jgi:hypothetical protein
MSDVIRKRAESLDTSAIDMEPFHPTLVDAFTNCAPYVEVLPGAFSKSERLSAFAIDKENVAFELSKKAVYNLPGVISSNIGRLEFSQAYGSLMLQKMFFVAPASPAFPIFIAGVSVNGNLAFSLNYVVPSGGGNAIKADMIRIRNRALEHLGFPNKASDKAI